MRQKQRNSLNDKKENESKDLSFEWNVLARVYLAARGCVMAFALFSVAT